MELEAALSMASRIIESEDVRHGRNATTYKWDDQRFVRCWNCGQVNQLDRESQSRRGSRASDGIKQAATELASAVATTDTVITVDSVTGFTTPDTGSITVFANGGRKRTTVTAASHGLKGGKVTITGTTSYNGDFHIDNVFTNSFDIRVAFVADDATGTWTVPEFILIYFTDTSAASATGKDMDRIRYTAISGSTFTGCTSINRTHSVDDPVRDGFRISSGCSFCGTLVYNDEP